MFNECILDNIEFVKKLDARAEAYNALSDKMQNANIDLTLLKKLVYTIEDLERFIHKNNLKKRLVKSINIET